MSMVYVKEHEEGSWEEITYDMKGLHFYPVSRVLWRVPAGKRKALPEKYWFRLSFDAKLFRQNYRLYGDIGLDRPEYTEEIKAFLLEEITKGIKFDLDL